MKKVLPGGKAPRKLVAYRAERRMDACCGSGGEVCRNCWRDYMVVVKDRKNRADAEWARVMTLEAKYRKTRK